MTRRAWYAFLYALIFTRALIKANIDVAKVVLRPRPKFRPGFLAVPMRAETDFEITTLANSITLTPGTITVHVVREHGVIVIHALDMGDDPDAVRADVQQTLEANILRFTRGRAVPGAAA
jgi:multicomponent Na+:H+ antiporter subunit E